MRKSPLTNDKKIKNMKNIDSKYVTLIFFLDLWKADYNDYNEQPVTVCKLCSLAVWHLRTEGTSKLINCLQIVGNNNKRSFINLEELYVIYYDMYVNSEN